MVVSVGYDVAVPFAKELNKTEWRESVALAS
jgi:hypothetical protein